MKHLAMPTPPAPKAENFRELSLMTGGYCPRSSIQLMKDRLQELPPSLQPPMYIPTHGMDGSYSPTKSCISYLKQLNLVHSFKPPMAFSMMRTDVVKAPQTLEYAFRGQ